MKHLLSLVLLTISLFALPPVSVAAVPAPEPTPMPRPAQVLSRPRWKLPALLLKQGSLLLSARAEVEVYSDGSTSCRLLRTTGRAEVDEMLLGWLRQWEWAPATERGQAVRSVERLDLDLVVE